MPAQILRPYQQHAVDQILQLYRDGARRILCVAPTGAGKTTAFGSLLANPVAPFSPNARGLVLTHRRELVTQASNRLREFGTDHGLILAGMPARPLARVQVASVQTLVKRNAPPAEFVVCDEAHLSTADTWSKILAQYPHARILGVTATPWRLGGKPLIGAYDASVVVATPAELCTQGFLCGYQGFSYLAPDLSKVGKVGDDYNQQQSAAAMSAIVPNVVQQWLKHARELSTVVFAVTVEHSKALCAEFVAAGVRAEHIDGGTPIEQRRAVLARVESGATRVLVNVGIATEGLDVPRLKCCVLARPTMSLARAIQMMGRVRRPWNGQTARIHDHAFVIAQHGLPDAPRDYTLHAKDVDAPALPSLTTCQKCFALFTGRVCPACAEVAPVGAREIREITDAELFEFASGQMPVPTASELPAVRVEWTAIGKTVEGVYRGQGEEQSNFGGVRKLYTIEGARRMYTLPGTSELDKKMARATLALGQKVKIVYTGEREIGGGRSMKTFTVEADDGSEEREQEQKEEARRLYVDERKSATLVADILGVAQETVSKWGREGGWLRSRAEAMALANAPDPEVVERARTLYVDEKKTMVEVGKLLCVHPSSVGNWGHAGGWLRTGAEAPDPEVVERARALYVDEEKSAKTVARILGVGHATLANWGHAGGWLRTGAEALALARGNSPEIVERARALYVDKKMTSDEVGKVLGVRPTTVCAWGRRGGWMRAQSPDPATVERARALYVNEKKSPKEVAKILKVGKGAVTMWGSRGGWLRSHAEAAALSQGKPLDTIERARVLYVNERKSPADVGKILGVHGSTVATWGRKGGWLRTAVETRALAASQRRAQRNSSDPYTARKQADQRARKVITGNAGEWFRTTRTSTIGKVERARFNRTPTATAARLELPVNVVLEHDKLLAKVRGRKASVWQVKDTVRLFARKTKAQIVKQLGPEAGPIYTWLKKNKFHGRRPTKSQAAARARRTTKGRKP